MNAMDEAHRARWQARLLELVDGTADAAAQQELEAHLATCTTCRADSQTLQALDRSLRAGLAPPSLGAEFDARVLERVRALDVADSHAMYERARRQQAKFAAELERTLESVRRVFYAKLGAIAAAMLCILLALPRELEGAIVELRQTVRFAIESLPQSGALSLTVILTVLPILLGLLGARRWS